MTYKTPSLILTILTLTLISGCVLITPYTPAIQQGKVINSEIMQQLRPGMSKVQVEYLLSSPDIIDSLSAEQWNYIYTYQSSFNAPRSEKKLILTFKDAKLDKVSGDYPPPHAIYSMQANQDSQDQPTSSRKNPIKLTTK